MKASRSTAESLIVLLMIIVLVLGAMGYCFAQAISNTGEICFPTSLRGLINTITCSHDLDPAELNVVQLIDDLQTARGAERLQIIRQLGMGSSSHWSNHAVKTLIGVLEDKSQVVVERQEAVQSLVQLAGLAREAIPIMVHSLGDADGEIRQRAISFLIRLGREVKQPLLQQLASRDDRRFASAALALSHYPSVSLKTVAVRLEQLSHHQDATIRSQVTQAMGHLATVNARDRLCKLLQDREPGVRLAAVNALGSVTQQQQLLHVLKPAMQDSDADVRQTVVRIISQHADSRTQEAILGMLTQESDAEAKAMMQRTLERMSWRRVTQSD